MRDGRRFATRRVEVLDGDKLCCELLASFAAADSGPEYEEPAPRPALPAPEDLPDEAQVMEEEGLDPMQPGFPRRSDRDAVRRRLPVARERRLAVPRVGRARASRCRRSRRSTPRRSRSSPTCTRTCRWRAASAIHFEPFGYTSLDQVVWVHRTEPWTDWLLLTSVSDVGQGGRAFSRRTLHGRDGRLIASMAQEQFVSFAAAEPIR